MRPRIALLLGAAAAVVVIGLDLPSDGPIARLSHWTIDRYGRMAGPVATDSDIVIVDIDEQSLREFGQWPWPRNRIAGLVERLGRAGAGAIGLDFVFAEPDQTSPTQLIPSLGADGLAPDALAALGALGDHDAALARAVHAAPVVVGVVLSDEGKTGGPAPKAGFAFVGEAPLREVPAFRGVIANLPAIETVAPGEGFLNVVPDDDGVIRRAPLILRVGDRAYPSLALEMLRLASNAKSYALRSGQGSEPALEALRVGSTTIPLSAEGSIWLRYGVSGQTRHVSAADLLANRTDLTSLAGKMILVGSTAIGLQDFKLTPLGAVMPGVEIHAEILAELHQGLSLFRPTWEWGLRVSAIIFLALGAALARAYLRVGWSLLLGACVILGCFVTSWWAFSRAGIILDPVAPAEAFALAWTMVSLMRQIEAEIEERRMRRAFSRYLAPALVDELIAHPKKLVLGGEMRVVTVMFCDIKGFSGLAEGLSPQDLTALLNAFLEPMTDVILAHRGTIDKYIGDCIMAFWNAPLDDPDHARNAIAAAIEMREVLAALNRELSDRHRDAGTPYRPLAMAIGINTGECCVGNMGSPHRFDYSILGDAVNVASRLAEFAASHDLDVAMGEDTAVALPAETSCFVEQVVVRGRQAIVRVFTVAAQTPDGAEKRREPGGSSPDVAPREVLQ
jgi:adenylate cyclase